MLSRFLPFPLELEGCLARRNMLQYCNAYIRIHCQQLLCPGTQGPRAAALVSMSQEILENNTSQSHRPSYLDLQGKNSGTSCRGSFDLVVSLLKDEHAFWGHQGGKVVSQKSGVRAGLLVNLAH